MKVSFCNLVKEVEVASKNYLEEYNKNSAMEMAATLIYSTYLSAKSNFRKLYTAQLLPRNTETFDSYIVSNKRPAFIIGVQVKRCKIIDRGIVDTCIANKFCDMNDIHVISYNKRRKFGDPEIDKRFSAIIDIAKYLDCKRETTKEQYEKYYNILEEYLKKIICFCEKRKVINSDYLNEMIEKDIFLKKRL